jgi:hypothetical protein
MVEIAQHDIEIQENRAHWERKPVLQRVYQAFYQAIARWARAWETSKQCCPTA